eukprot:UN09974
MAKLTSEDMKKAFDTFDSDNDGKIGSEDWKRILSILKQHCKYELEDMEYDEFAKIGNEIANNEKESENAINKTFKMLDETNKGYISPQDIKRTMVQLGDPLTDKEIKAVIQEITNGVNDKITLNDFKNAMQ